MAENLFDKVYNPDVLSCLANLSNDEVFTPPDVANKMLDMLPQELFCDPNSTFLDPACKSGIFLREIAKRLIKGLEKEIPDLQARLDHIFHKQLYGIAITEMTSLLSRRSVYCSKYPNSKYSVSKFDDVEGNIRYKNIAHSWVNGKCKYCGASKSEYGVAKRDGLETHAYELIHTLEPEEIFKMKFDVIIGNPPYQLNDGGGVGASAMPIYHKFVRQAKALNPKFLVMIIPARWFSGGRGLDEFRDEMLNDRKIRVMCDYFNAADCFPGVEIKGGICYFLRDRDNEGLCKIETYRSNGEKTISNRFLLENGMRTYIRNVEQINILYKVQEKNEKMFCDMVSSNDPFGFDVRVSGTYKRVKPVFKKDAFNGAVKFYYNGWRKNGLGFIERSVISKNKEWIDKYKIFIPKAWGSGDSMLDWLTPIVVEPGSVCTETYLTVGPFENKEIAVNVKTYINTKFFHFMVSMLKITQNSMKNVYSLVPQQDFTKSWTDEELYKKYNLTNEEIDFIESMIKPMDLGSDLNG